MKKKYDLKKEYLESINFIRECKKHIYFVIICFLITVFIGFIFPVPESLRKTIINIIKEIVEQTQGMNLQELIMFILTNNAQISFIGMLTGFFLGVFPIIISLSNGYFVGVISSIIVKEQGYLILWKLIPHGIFELTAVFISLGIGSKLGVFIFSKNKHKTFKEYFIKSIKTFFYILLPLLTIAAIIEGILIYFT